jgi:hypothetical protein
MTTKRILEIEDAGAGFPDCYHGGQGFVSRSTQEARIKRAKAIIAMVRRELGPSSATFEEAEAMTKLRGRVV